MRTSTITRRVSVALATLGVALAGCADDDERSRGASASAFVERGNAVLCDARHALAGDVVGQLLSGEDPSAAEARERFLPAYRELRTGLAGLEPRAADKDGVRAVLTGLDAAIARAEREPALMLGDEDPFARVERQMEALGLDGCA